MPAAIKQKVLFTCIEQGKTASAYGSHGTRACVQNQGNINYLLALQIVDRLTVRVKHLRVESDCKGEILGKEWS